MTLNERNRILTKDTGRFAFPDAIDHDISIMDERQLERFIRFSFADKWDLKLVPEEVWVLTSESREHSTARTFGSYLAGLRRRSQGNGSSNGEHKTKIDSEIKDRMDKVLTKIMSGYLKAKGTPSKESLAFAEGVLTMAFQMKWYEGGENSPARQFDRALMKATSKSADGAIPVTEALEIGRQLKPVEAKNPIYGLVSRIKADPRYARRLSFPPLV